MRVCLISYEFPPVGGGEGTYTHDLMKALSSNGVQVILITPKWPGVTMNLEGQNVSVIHVNPIFFPGLKTTSFMLRANRKLKKIVQSIDLIHYTNDYCGFGMSSMQIGKPVVATIHHTHLSESLSISTHQKMNLVEKLRFRLSQWFLSMMEKSTLKNADRIVAVSEFTAKNARLVYPALEDKINVVLNGVDEKCFSSKSDSLSFRQGLGIASQPVILYVGRITQSKGLRFLLRSMHDVVKSVPEAKLVIVGSGSQKDQDSIKEQVAKDNLSASVLFAGRVDAKVLPKAYAASDLVVLPSLVEGFGLVLLEAMAMSRPLIATNVGPTSEIVTNGVEGVIVPSADCESLAREITRLLLSKAESARMGENGRKRVERQFTLDVWSIKMIEVYRGCLSNHLSTSQGERCC